jgi:purine-binding chemotaxis protein CheW
MAAQSTEQDRGLGASLAHKYLTFSLAGEEYGLEILRVREINGLMDITPVPRMPGYVRGVINLRGKVIPVMDLRLKFDMERAEDTKETCIIVVDLDELFMGIVVDRVSEVLDIYENEIDETPEFGVQVETDFILGMGKTKGKVIILLDIKKVLGSGELSTIASGV